MADCATCGAHEPNVIAGGAWHCRRCCTEGAYASLAGQARDLRTRLASAERTIDTLAADVLRLEAEAADMRGLAERVAAERATLAAALRECAAAAGAGVAPEASVESHCRVPAEVRGAVARLQAARCPGCRSRAEGACPGCRR